MTEKYHRPEWDCTDDILDTTEEIGKAASKILLGEFVHGGGASKKDIHKILQEFAQRNVEAALDLAAKGLMEHYDYARNTHIDIMEAVRIVQELDYMDEDD